MDVGVLGTGIVGRTIGGKLIELGNDVMVGTRDVDVLMARTELDAMGNAPFAEWSKANPAAKVAPFEQAAAHGEIVVNATNGDGSLQALASAGASNLDGKILIDVSNPLDFSKGFPPTLSVSNTDSLGEQIQRAVQGASVVKTLNTMNAFLMVDPGQLAGGDHSVFVCGNDAAAKVRVTEILRDFGWRDVIDLGDITMARGTEMYLPLWVRLFAALEAPMFNVKVVR